MGEGLSNGTPAGGASDGGGGKLRLVFEVILVFVVLLLVLALLLISFFFFRGTLRVLERLEPSVSERLSKVTSPMKNWASRRGGAGGAKGRTASRRPVLTDTNLRRTYADIANLIKSGMDTSVSPCSDFYRFMCGKHTDSKPPGWSWFNLAERKASARLTLALSNSKAAKLSAQLEKPRDYAQRVYDSCANLSLPDSLDDIHRLYSSLGGSPLVAGHHEAGFNPVRAMLRLQKLTGSQMVGEELLNIEKTQNYIFGFETDVLHMTLGVEKLAESMEKYLNATAGFVQLMGWDLPEDWENVTAAYIQRAKELKHKVGGICASFQPITAFKAANASLIMDALATELPDSIQVRDKVILITKGCVVSEGIEELLGVLSEKADVIRAGTVGRWLSLWTNATGWKSNWVQRSCPELMRILNEPIFQRIFVTLHGPDVQTRLPVRALIEHIRSRLTNRIFELDWLDTYSKNRALNKINSIIPRIGYAPWILNDTQLALFYKDLPELDNGTDTSFLTLLVALRSNQWTQELKEFAEKKGARYTRFLANQNTFYVNAAYHAGENTINVQLGIMQPPMFDFGYPVPLMYGVLGFVIAHEITHSVDTIGMYFTLRGEQQKWVSDASMDLFERKSRCFVEQYNGFCYPDLAGVGGTHCVNGSRVLSENIADDGGMKLSYAAFKNFLSETKRQFMFEVPGFEGYTDEQLFFMSVAAGWCETNSPQELVKRLTRDAHSPNPSRVNGTMQNFPPFAAAFKCPLGSPMNPEKKCSLW